MPIDVNVGEVDFVELPHVRSKCVVFYIIGNNSIMVYCNEYNPCSLGNQHNVKIYGKIIKERKNVITIH